MIDDLIKQHPLIPVATLDNMDDACWLAKVLLNNHIRVIEVTLRTDNALQIIKMLKQEFKELVIGAGTVVNVDDLSAVCKSGADFAVSPGFLPFMVTQAQMYSLPFLPAVSSISEAMQAASLGLKTLKVYPVDCLGGAPYLSALNAVLPELYFCPTGGINESNCKAYQTLSYVSAVGMSQLASREFIDNRDETALMELIKRCQVSM